MAGKKSDLGPTGHDLSYNVRRHRQRHNLTYNELSRRLDRAGRAIPPLGLRNIEAGTRRVDVDDLMGLAVALGISPITLLVPDSDSKRRRVEGTATGKQFAEDLWAWLRATDPLVGSGEDHIGFALRARPVWAQDTLAEELMQRKLDAQAEVERRRAQRSRERG
ncbi:MAG TPA: helix-turn-helix transcriptional regulator [Mycobacterium sp.]|nr:helix-turn-helix transcriptional regulator [Mycobacterium sp.]